MAAPAGLPDKWWRDADLLRAEYGEHGTLERISDAHGPSPKTLASWWRKHELPPFAPGPRVGGYASDPPIDGGQDEPILAALAALGDSATVEQLADHCDLAPRRVREALERLGHYGYRLSADAESVRLERTPHETGEHHPASPSLFDGDLFRFAVVSDTHLGSRAERVDWLHTAYDVIEREGVTFVLHPGDLVDGLGIYRTQNVEVAQHTYGEQVEHAVASYPAREGIVTQIISGNHDLEGEYGRAGADPVLAVANRRDDFLHLGRYSAYIDLPNGAAIHILHPMGGASYAMSYRPQKIVESYEGGEKPGVLLIGHWHRAGYFFVRNVHVLLAGTFQGPTTYSVRKAFGQPGYGFWIVSCRLADDGSIVGFRPEWFPFYLNRAV